MYKKILLTGTLIGLASISYTQDRERKIEPYSVTIDHSAEGAITITQYDLKKHLNILAADDMEGREVGTEANNRAAQYIAAEFEKMGLPKIGNDGTYFQKIPFHQTSWDSISLSVNGTNYSVLKDFVSEARRNNDLFPIIADQVVFLGYGIDDPQYSDYKKDVSGSVILIYKGEPMNPDGTSRITGTTEMSDWSKNPVSKFETAKKKGVRAVLMIEDELLKQVGQMRNFILRPTLQLGEPTESPNTNHMYISTDVARNIIGDKFEKVVKIRDQINAKGKAKSLKLKTNLEMVMIRNVKSLMHENVLGFIEGTDPDLKDEVVVVTAHYDHVGKRGDDIFNGADDNASGTSTVMEIAEALAGMKEREIGPRRSILCMLVTGEEKGLLGSRHYIENPIFPLDKTIANVNVDMVGRIDEKHTGNPDYIYVIGSDRLSTELHEINENMNEQYTQLELDYTYNAPDDPNRFYYRSDHYNFARNGIPAIFYFNGTHEDYHRSTDTSDKIEFEKMEKVARLIYYTTWELAMRDKRIEVNVSGGN